jgi:hypothetical protein
MSFARNICGEQNIHLTKVVTKVGALPSIVEDFPWLIASLLARVLEEEGPRNAVRHGSLGLQNTGLFIQMGQSSRASLRPFLFNCLDIPSFFSFFSFFSFLIALVRMFHHAKFN